MAAPSTTVWEVRAGGSGSSDLNGGGFSYARPAATPRYTVTDLACANNSTTTVTSATGGFTGIPANSIVAISGGTGFNAGVYWIVSVTNDTTLMLDRTPVASGSPSASGGTLKIGGVDYANADSPAATFSDLSASGTTTLNSAGGTFTVAMVGNLIQIATGGTLTAGFYEVVAFTDANNVVLDTSPGSGSGSGRIGGALASVYKLSQSMVASNRAWVKYGTYSESSLPSFAQSVATPSPTTPPTTLIGYYTTRGDLTPWTPSPNRPQIRPAADFSNAMWFTGSGWRVENLDVATSSGTAQTLLRLDGAYSWVAGCKVSGGASIASIYSNTTTGFYVERCEVTGTTGGVGIRYRSSAVIRGNYIHDLSGTVTAAIGYGSLGSSSVVARNIVANINGSSSVGIDAGSGTTVQNNTIYHCSSHGIQLSNQTSSPTVQGNILSSNGGYGLSCTTASLPASYYLDGNAYYNNSLGTRNNIDGAGSVTATYGSAPYSNTKDVLLTGDPFTSVATGDFSLNNTAGAGAACRASGQPSSWPALSLTSYPDMGAVQHQDSGGGGGAANIFGSSVIG